MEFSNDDLTRLWDSIFAETTPERVAARRQAVKTSLERIRTSTADREESEILRAQLQGVIEHTRSAEEQRHMTAIVLYYLVPEPITIRELGRMPECLFRVAKGYRYIHECARLDTAAVEVTTRSGLLTVKGKGGKVRSVPVDTAALEILRHRADITRRGCKLFIPDDVKTDTIMRELEQFIIRIRNNDRENGVHLTVHGLRHTWAAEQYRKLIASGRTPYEARKQISQWLGHERDSVTKIYLASLKKNKKDGGTP